MRALRNDANVGNGTLATRQCNCLPRVSREGGMASEDVARVLQVVLKPRERMIEPLGVPVPASAGTK